MADMAGMGSQAIGMAAAKKADLVQFKVQMDGLKKRLANNPTQEEELQQACRDFEAVFIGKLWEQMEKSVPKDGLLHSKQEDMYKSMFSKEFSEAMADAGGIGLADMIYDQLAQKLKQASNDTLAANTKIKPLAENGRPDIRTLNQVKEDLTRLKGPEPQGPRDIIPETVGEVATDDEAAGGYETEKKAAESIGPVTQIGSARDVSGLSQVQVEAELNRLAYALRGNDLLTGKVTGKSAHGENEEDGRILAEI